MDLGDEDERRPTIADVPGLIEGASSGAGLGHAFLRHVERTRILVHVVDGSSRDPEWDYDVIREELARPRSRRSSRSRCSSRSTRSTCRPPPRPGRRSGEARKARGHRRRSRSRRPTGDGLDEFRARHRRAAARRRRARRAARAGRASSSTGSRRWATASASSSTTTAPSASAASGSSASPPRPTSTSRNRPSASSATSPGSASTPSCAGRGSPPGDTVRIGGDRARMGGAALGADVTAAAARDRARLARASSAARSIRSTSATSRSPRRRAEALGLERVLFVPGRRAAAQAGTRDHARRNSVWRWSSSPSPATPVRGRSPASSTAPGRRTRSTPSRTCVPRDSPRAPRRTSSLILSAEAFLGLMTWREPRRVLELARVVVAPRDGYPDADPAFLARSTCRTLPTGRPSSMGRVCASRRASCGHARRPAGRSATSSRMRSRPTSATMRSTSTHGGTRRS